MRTLNVRYPPLQFAVFRILFGGLLMVEFLRLIPYAAELFGAEGAVPLSLTAPFPNLFVIANETWMLQLVLALAASLAACVAAGFLRRPCAALLAYVWASLLARNMYITVPSDGYVGWFLLALVVIPTGEPLALTRRRDWTLPPFLFAVAWVVVSLSYTVSGFDKLSSPSWQSGAALSHIFASPVARGGWIGNALAMLLQPLLRVGSYLALGLEVLYVPLSLFNVTRKYLWLATMAMHVCVLIALNIEAVSLMMLAVHFFLYDHRWRASGVFRGVRGGHGEDRGL